MEEIIYRDVSISWVWSDNKSQHIRFGPKHDVQPYIEICHSRPQAIEFKSYTYSLKNIMGWVETSLSQYRSKSFRKIDEIQ